ncbi:hypothetical protein Landi51_02484 [Colletotrichum acutatum]
MDSHMPQADAIFMVSTGRLRGPIARSTKAPKAIHEPAAGGREGVGLSQESSPGRDVALQILDKTPSLSRVIQSDGGAFCMWLTLPTAHSNRRPATSLATWTIYSNAQETSCRPHAHVTAVELEKLGEHGKKLGEAGTVPRSSAPREESETPTRALRVFPPPWGVIVVVRVGVGDLDEAMDAQNSKRQYDNPMADSGNVRKPFPRESLLQKEAQSGAAISR